MRRLSSSVCSWRRAVVTVVSLSLLFAWFVEQEGASNFSSAAVDESVVHATLVHLRQQSKPSSISPEAVSPIKNEHVVVVVDHTDPKDPSWVDSHAKDIDGGNPLGDDLGLANAWEDAALRNRRNIETQEQPESGFDTTTLFLTKWCLNRTSRDLRDEWVRRRRLQLLSTVRRKQDEEVVLRQRKPTRRGLEEDWPFTFTTTGSEDDDRSSSRRPNVSFVKLRRRDESGGNMGTQEQLSQWYPLAGSGGASVLSASVSPLCFGEVLGMDYQSGKEFDLLEVRGVKDVDVCLDTCLQRNEALSSSHSSRPTQHSAALVDKGLPPHDTGSSSHLWCAAVVYNNFSKTCWLKRKGELQKRKSDCNSYVLGLESLPLKRPTAVVDASVLSESREANVHESLKAVLATSRREPLLSVLYGILSEHQYVETRMIPSLRTWLRRENYVILLVRATVDVMERSRQLLLPYLRSPDPSLVRRIEYLVRNRLHDIHPYRDREKLDLQRSAELLAKVRRNRRLASPGDGKAIASAQELLPSMRQRALTTLRKNELISFMNKYQLSRQLDRGEFRLARDSGAWKDLPGLDAIYRRFRNFSYYMMIDDDSYIVQRNFEILLSSFYLHKLNPWNESLYTGVLSLWYQPVSQSRGVVTPFIQGGAGILMSNAAVAAAYPKLTECRVQCDFLPHGDVRLGCCMKRVARVDSSFETTFWHMHIYRALGRDGRQSRSLFPVSFHRMKNASMIDPLDKCIRDEETRMRLAGVSRAMPVSWEALERCYEWMRNTPEHEYKFQMVSLH